MIQSLTKSIQESAENKILEIELEKFSKELYNKILNLDEKKDPNIVIKELILPAKNNMKQIILNLFNRFPKCYDIEIHLKDKDSWTNTDSKELAVMKNSDGKKLLRNEMKRIIETLKKLLSENNNFINYSATGGDDDVEEKEEEKEEEEEEDIYEDDFELDDDGEEENDFIKKDIMDWNNLIFMHTKIKEVDEDE